MDEFGRRLKARAKELGISDAEVARRAGITERRYGHYVTGAREPNLPTLLQICRALATTPDGLLIGSWRHGATSKEDRLRSRIMAAVNLLDAAALLLVIQQVEAVVKYTRRLKQSVKSSQ